MNAPRRQVLSNGKSLHIATDIIKPFIERLRKNDSDPQMQQMIAMAMQFLDKPIDSRPHQAN